jgi:glycosyltransferase involved in cell wall biosynthesis
MRVAVIHEWLATFGGSERVTEEILALYPGADLFALVDFYPPHLRKFLAGTRITTSFIQRLPLARRHFRWYLLLMPLAVEQFDLSQYELVISSSHAVAKGVMPRPDQIHVSYVHTPMRYAWDRQDDYLAGSGMWRAWKSASARVLMHYLRLWDARTAHGVDQFIANSEFVARRINKIYGRRAAVVYPPVDVERFEPTSEKSRHYISVARFVPYKRIDLLIEAFTRMPSRELLLVGDGPEWKALRAKAPSNVKLLGRLAFDEMHGLLRSARGFVFAAEEDFGIAAVEAQACGTPVIAYGRGGASETVVDERTGVLFNQQTPDALVEAIRRFERMGKFDASSIRRNAERFSANRFRTEFSRRVAAAVEELERDRGAAIAQAQAGSARDGWLRNGAPDCSDGRRDI